MGSISEFVRDVVVAWLKFAAIVAAIMVGLFVWLLNSDFDGGGEKAEKDEAGPKSTARFICREAIRGQLLDPSSAQWGTFDDGFYGGWPAAEREGGRVVVQPEFRARNGFGATILSDWTCEVRITEEEVSLIRLEQH